MRPADCIDSFAELSTGQSALPSWKAWLAIGFGKLMQDVLRLTETVARHGERRRQHRALLSLDERMRKDIGLTAADIWLETSMPLWRK